MFRIVMKKVLVGLLMINLHSIHLIVNGFVPSTVHSSTYTNTIQQHYDLFTVLHSTATTKKRNNPRQPSKVTDDAGVTPSVDDDKNDNIEIVNTDTIIGLREINDLDELNNNPIPYQKWRRGDTNGCHDPITAEWRVKAEQLIRSAVDLSINDYNSISNRISSSEESTILDITWYLTCVVITINEKHLYLSTSIQDSPRDLLKSNGPVVDIIEPIDPMYYDPTDPEPDEIWDIDDDSNILYVRETDAEAYDNKIKKTKLYAPYDPELDGPNQYNNINVDDTDFIESNLHIDTKISSFDSQIPTTTTDIDEGDTSSTSNTATTTNNKKVTTTGGKGTTTISEKDTLFMNIESRSDVAVKVTEDEQERYDENEQSIGSTQLFESQINLDTNAISNIAYSINTVLQQYENELHILSRHEIILSGQCMGATDIIETQSQFNMYRNHFIIVQTIDPFGSNRILKGTLIDRNAMDLLINKKGRLVTIPLNFVQCVRLGGISNSNDNSSGGSSSTGKGKGGSKNQLDDDDDDNNIDNDDDDEYYDDDEQQGVEMEDNYEEDE